MVVTKEEDPWVYAKQGDPNRVIAALELMGTIMSVMLFGKLLGPRVLAQGVLTASTDNQGNSFAVKKFMSSKWPLTVMVIELSEQLRALGTTMTLSWLSRDLNVEADAITNEMFEAFDPRLRLDTSASSLRWRVLPRLMEASAELYRNIVDERNCKKVLKAIPKLRADKRMKVADPW